MSQQRRWIIGRAPDCDLIATGPAVSGKHCCLTETPKGFFLDDLQSSNGTYVNGTRITAQTLVSKGDKITLGLTTPMPWPAPAPAPVSPGYIPTLAHPVSAPSVAASGTIRIGRAPDNEVILDYPMVSAHHARIATVNGKACIEDLGSSNGTAINHPDKRIRQAALAATDTVYFGSLHIPASRLLAGNAALGESPHLTVSHQGKPITFGRDPQCEQVLNAPMISWHHARLSGSPGSLLLEDLGSTNGTYINGQRIRNPVPVKIGDVIGLGTFTFKLTAGGDLEKRDYRGNVTIEARNIRVDVPGRRLLDDVSLTIYPSEFVGLMGPSGAGKTTLMNVLNGYTPPTDGDVLLNGKSLYDHYSQFSTYLGYVPQDDLIHRDLTVGQALYYTARLRFPADYSKDEIDARISVVLKQLGLEGTENVLIGSPEKKGISGGQRKRVNLAMELLTDPLVLFLDEPTSGLSSEDALMVMKVLRGLADAGKTILLTIHQPSLEAYRLLDNLVLISKDAGSSDPGKLTYYGPAYPDAVHFFNPQGTANSRPGVDPTPDEVLRGLAKRPTKEWISQYQSSRYQTDYITKRSGKRPPRTSKLPLTTTRGSLGFSQWMTLVERCLAIKLKDSWNTAILMAQAPIVAILVVFVFGKQVGETITAQTSYQDWAQVAHSVGITTFLLTLAALWFGCSNAAREIVGEWAIYHRERMINLKLPSYVASKLTVLGGLCLIQCAILLTIAYFGCDLKGSWLALYLFLVLVSFVGVAIGLTLSAVAKTSEVAIGLLPIILLPMVILGGMMQPINKMSLPVRGFTCLVPSRWAFEGMLLLETENQPKKAPPALPIVNPEYLPDNNESNKPAEDMAESFFPKKHFRSGVAASTLALLLLFLGAVGAIHVILRRRDVH